MSKARDMAGLITTAASISDLDARIVISSASPISGNINGRFWIDISTASAPGISIYGENNWKEVRPRIKAVGGIKTQLGAYTVHTFLGSSTFTSLEPLTVDYLVVGGGGSRGGTVGGVVYDAGGGGGQVLTGSLTINSQSYSVTVGAGGVAGGVGEGNNSVFSSVTANKGNPGVVTGAGGSSGSGRSGGARNGFSSGGGGGDQANGTNAPNGTTGGSGGVGRDVSSTWGTGVGESGYFGGGGGGYSTSGAASVDGLGNGAANTGGGGTSQANLNPTKPNGASGNSGIIIIRYLTQESIIKIWHQHKY